jgi:hypothetical protein
MGEYEMTDLSTLNEVEQKIVMKKFMQGQGEPIPFNNMLVIIPNNILLGYACVGECKKMKYVRIKKREVQYVMKTIPCTYHCHRNSIMRLRTYGAENIYLLTSTPEPKKKVFNLKDFF